MLSQLSATEKEELKNKFERVLAGETVEHREIMIIKGNEIHLTTSYSPMQNEAGIINMIAGFTSEVTSLTTNGKAKNELGLAGK